MTRDCNPDLFDGLDQQRRMTGDGDQEPRPILAIPCGFVDRRNMPCRRLGVRPVTIDGQRFPPSRLRYRPLRSGLLPG